MKHLLNICVLSWNSLLTTEWYKNMKKFYKLNFNGCSIHRKVNKIKFNSIQARSRSPKHVFDINFIYFSRVRERMTMTEIDQLMCTNGQRVNRFSLHFGQVEALVKQHCIKKYPRISISSTIFFSLQASIDDPSAESCEEEEW